MNPQERVEHELRAALKLIKKAQSLCFASGESIAPDVRISEMESAITSARSATQRYHRYRKEYAQFSKLSEEIETLCDSVEVVKERIESRVHSRVKA